MEYVCIVSLKWWNSVLVLVDYSWLVVWYNLQMAVKAETEFVLSKARFVFCNSPPPFSSLELYIDPAVIPQEPVPIPLGVI